MDWKKKSYLAGTTTLVYDVNHNYIGEGVLVHDFSSDGGTIPEIKMNCGKIILGSECWWIPMEETERKPIYCRICGSTASLRPEYGGGGDIHAVDEEGYTYTCSDTLRTHEETLKHLINYIAK